MFLRFGFLDANDVGRLFFHPRKKTFSGGRTNAVGVETDYTKQIADSGRNSLQYFGDVDEHTEIDLSLYHTWPVLDHPHAGFDAAIIPELS